MYRSFAMPAFRRAMYAVAPTLLVLAMTSGPSASAQSEAKSSDPAIASESASNNAAFSSSTDAPASALEAAKEALTADPAAPSAAAADQYGGGRYGRRDHSWMSHLAFEAGGGVNAPSDDSSPYITWGGNFTVGAGYRFTPHISLLAEYQFIDDKLPGGLIGETGANGGHAHIWSLTMAPVVDFFPKMRNDIYVTGGGGFYRKVTSFTDPEDAEYCTYYYCGITTVNQVVGHFSSNQGGWNVGMGLTHRLGDGPAKIFAEARYLDVLTPAVTSQPNGLGLTTVAEDTKLIPVTLGIRF